jgi:hypothetical protein
LFILAAGSAVATKMIHDNLTDNTTSYRPERDWQKRRDKREREMQNAREIKMFK